MPTTTISRGMLVAAAMSMAAGTMYVIFFSRKKKHTSGRRVRGIVNYEAQHVPASLLSSGKVYVDRTTTGADKPPVGEEQRTVSVHMHDARGLDLSLDLNGVRLVEHVIHVGARAM